MGTCNTIKGPREQHWVGLEMNRKGNEGKSEEEKWQGRRGKEEVERKKKIRKRIKKRMKGKRRNEKMNRERSLVWSGYCLEEALDTARSNSKVILISKT